MNEAETRAELIDPQLKACGWGVIEDSKILREYHITAGRIQTGGIRAKKLMAPFEDKGGTWQLRYYQEIAVKNTLEALANNQDRILLTLATGTVKPPLLFRLLGSCFKHDGI